MHSLPRVCRARLRGLLEYLFGTVLDGRNSAVCTGVEEILHRAPTDFVDWAKGAAAGVVAVIAKVAFTLAATITTGLLAGLFYSYCFR